MVSVVMMSSPVRPKNFFANDDVGVSECAVSTVKLIGAGGAVFSIGGMGSIDVILIFV